MQQHEQRTPVGPDPEFLYHFKQLIELAGWNDARGGDSALFRFEPNNTRQPGKYHSQCWEFTDATRVSTPGTTESYNPKSDLVAPAWFADQIKPHTRYYDRTAITGTAAATALQRLGLDYTAAQPRGAWIDRRLAAKTLPATYGRVCLRGCANAGTFGDAALAAGTYAEWATASQTEANKADAVRIGSNSMAITLFLAEQQGVSYDNATDYIEVLAKLDHQNNPHHDALRSAALDTLSTVILNDGPLPLKSRIKAPPTGAARQAAFALDAHKVLDDQWWFGNGITAGAVFTAPEFLPTLHGKLADKEAAQRIGDFLPVGHSAYISGYVTQFLKACGNGETRGLDLQFLLKATEFVTRSGVVDLGRLIDVGNLLVKDKNLDEGTTRFPEYDKEDLRNVGDALLLILDRSRRYTVDPVARADHFKKDMQHVEIVDMLCMGFRRSRSTTLLARLGGPGAR